MLNRRQVIAGSLAGAAAASLTRYPAFAFISELRQPEKFGKSMDTLLRTAALFTTQQFKLKLAEEKHQGETIVAYRFDEKEEMKQDTDDIRFNPRYNQISGTYELLRFRLAGHSGRFISDEEQSRTGTPLSQALRPLPQTDGCPLDIIWCHLRR